ncbi:uncharacterized protein LOC114973900 isoform X2 [Acropora millepora]|uniref:uncharacterized protein LOC114973900 isoform X2 n=1 Tax=Acropora millepora TaxID=45264 RepID=UPI001CF26D5D|nr:uncharacterized protein LOC114973900 isoform X2 [Acropora millepora]
MNYKFVDEGDSEQHRPFHGEIFAFELKRPPDLQKCSVVLIESLLSSRFIDTVHPSNFRRSSCTEMCNLQAFMQICLTRFLDTEDVNLQWNAGLI